MFMLSSKRKPSVERSYFVYDYNINRFLVSWPWQKKPQDSTKLKMPVEEKRDKAQTSTVNR